RLCGLSQQIATQTAAGRLDPGTQSGDGAGLRESGDDEPLFGNNLLSRGCRLGGVTQETLKRTRGRSQGGSPTPRIRSLNLGSERSGSNMKSLFRLLSQCARR